MYLAQPKLESAQLQGRIQTKILESSVHFTYLSNEQFEGNNHI